MIIEIKQRTLNFNNDVIPPFITSKEHYYDSPLHPRTLRTALIRYMHGTYAKQTSFILWKRLQMLKRELN